ncbi:hypothetical protein BH11CYA1_BH11CYA1_22830 [soil metagenome]
MNVQSILVLFIKSKNLGPIAFHVDMLQHNRRLTVDQTIK